MKTYEEGLKDGQALALAALTRLSSAYDIIYDVEHHKSEMTLKVLRDFTEPIAVIEVAKSLVEAEFWNHLKFEDHDNE